MTCAARKRLRGGDGSPDQETGKQAKTEGKLAIAQFNALLKHFTYAYSTIATLGHLTFE